jgi:hypothetical protein
MLPPGKQPTSQCNKGAVLLASDAGAATIHTPQPIRQSRMPTLLYISRDTNGNQTHTHNLQPLRSPYLKPKPFFYCDHILELNWDGWRARGGVAHQLYGQVGLQHIREDLQQV